MSTLSSDGLQALLKGVGVQGPIPPFPLADTKNSPVDIYISYLAETVTQLTGCEPSVAYESIQWANDVGDLVVVVPRLRLPDVDPRVLAEELQYNFPDTPLYAAPFSDAYNLRFFFDSRTLAAIVLPYIIDRGNLYGEDAGVGLHSPGSPDGGRRKVVVEFSSPNLGQEFDGNHLRSTIIGAYVASIYEGMGWDVCRMSFLGDWGKNIGLLATGWFRFGSEELFAADPLRHLLDIYTEIGALFKAEQKTPEHDKAEKRETPIAEERDAFFKKMEEGDPDALSLWRRFREVCVVKYAELYARLHIDFDEYSGESQVTHETTVEVESALKENGVEEEGEEAWIINFKGHGYKGLGTPVARHQNGTTSYLLRDIAAVLERSRKYSFDKMIYVVSAKQDTHFQQVFKALELMGHTDLAGRLQHVSFGKSQGLSSQPGAGGTLLGDILNQCQSAVLEFLHAHPGDFSQQPSEHTTELADGLGTTTLMAEELSIKRTSTFVFDLAKMATYDGYTGLTLQYWLDRVKVKLKGSSVDRDRLPTANYSMFEEEAYGPFVDVIRLLVQFPGVVKSSFRLLESSAILTYLFRLVDLLALVWTLEATQEEGEEELDGEQIDGPAGSSGNKPAKEAVEQESPAEDGSTETVDEAGGVPPPDANPDVQGQEVPVEDENKEIVDGDDGEDAARGDELAKMAQDEHQGQGVEQDESLRDEETKEGKSNDELEEDEHEAGSQLNNDSDQADLTKQLDELQLDSATEYTIGHGQEQGNEGEQGPSTGSWDKGKQRAPDTEPELSDQDILKLAVYQCVRHVLENGMQMAGLVPMSMRT
ncbi:hypothetical protein A1O1_07349 [Capronia coronata CBS 617.96]|uniref:Arginyl-tRNA synthetase catalytic core domain-containing protein n=1 Tax=Capronia coronata CBS 617.96 TaxID=1182541 RepID=W9XU13_9EURO|nr:uncharacterized protein A1O1_07349 [Capronia coronata CBS 617.96]EXJ83723.1 hypothetical protein A1O1_07349 [Capronia coronata CBS 617.96]